MYNQLRSLAFRLNLDAITDQKALSAYPFWILNLPEGLKKSILQAIAKASNRPEDKVHLPVRVLNQAARMLIPDLISVVRRAGEANVQPWLYGYISDEETAPASSEAMQLIVRSWIRTSLHKNISSITRNALTQQVTTKILAWKREVIDLTRWDLAENQTARPYIENSVFTSFILLPDLVAARLSKAEFSWGPHRLQFRRAPLSPGHSGVELISWPPLEYPEGKFVWPYSVMITITLQTVPFQPFPELHCDLGIRRWAGPEIKHLPGGMETSVYLLDRVPWIEGGHHSRSFQVAPIAWEHIPASEQKAGELDWRLNWDSALIQLLNDLHPKDVFPNPQLLKENPASFIQRDSRSGKPSAAVVFRNGITPPHGAGTGLTPRDRHHFVEQIAAYLSPDFVFISPFQRSDYKEGIFIPPNPFFEKPKDLSPEDVEGQLVGTYVDRLHAIKQTIKRIIIETWYQSEEVHQALRSAIYELLGYPLTSVNGDAWTWQDITIVVRSQRLGAYGDTLIVKPGSRETQYDRLREAMQQRATQIASGLPDSNGHIGALIELDNEDKFNGKDPKPAIRIGFGRKHYLTQFIVPQPDDSRLPDKDKLKLQKQLEERSRSAVRDLLRQFGVVGLPPLIASKQPRKKSVERVTIPDPLHYLGFWLIKQQTKSSATHIAQTLPVLIHMASNTSDIQVLIPGLRNWLTYSDALIALSTQQNPCMLNAKEMCQFLLETLELCLPEFGDTLLFCHAQNARTVWKWLGNEHIGKGLPRELEHYPQLRIVRLRTGDHEIPEWYAQSEDEAYGTSQGVFMIGESGHVFASVQEKPPTAMLSKDISKVLTQVKWDKKTQTNKEYNPRPDKPAWNAGIVEMVVTCTDSKDALMCAVVANELRHHFASHFGSPTMLPLPLHLASLLGEYLLPLTKATKGRGGAMNDSEDDE